MRGVPFCTQLEKRTMRTATTRLKLDEDGAWKEDVDADLLAINNTCEKTLGSKAAVADQTLGGREGVRPPPDKTKGATTCAPGAGWARALAWGVGTMISRGRQKPWDGLPGRGEAIFLGEATRDCWWECGPGRGRTTFGTKDE